MKTNRKMNDQTKADRLLLAQLEDKLQQAEIRYMITAGNFLDAHQRKIAEEFMRRGGSGNGVRMVFYGGYEDAERCMPVFLPDYITGDNVEEELSELVRIIRVYAGSAPRQVAEAATGRDAEAATGRDADGAAGRDADGAKNRGAAGRFGGRTLTHRDYLGSLLALGLDREVTGDILVRGEDSALGPGADIIVTEEIADFITMNYDKAGHTSLTAEVLPISRLHVEPVRLESHRDTVASLRLDSIVASAFRLSRAKAAEAIRRGLVSVNSAEALKVDAEVEAGDRIVLRGQGKVILSEVGGTTRKDRIRITLSAYR